jgi:hypothetical protein
LDLEVEKAPGGDLLQEDCGLEVGLPEEDYFFLAEFLAAARSWRAIATTRNISSQGAGLPVQISNCRAAW